MSMLSNFLPRFTNSTRSGSERCPYCGGWHSRDEEFIACANRYSYRESPYTCDRCGSVHPTQGAADACCAHYKRYERRYDPDTYDAYTSATGNSYSGYTAPDYPNSDSSSEGVFDFLFNAGGGKTAEKPSSSDSVWDSFLNAGGSGKKSSWF